MFCTKFLNIIREYELDYFKNNLDRNSRILEIGGGTGIQAKLLSEAGFNIESIDLKDSTYSGDRVYPVVDYDGTTIPFDENEFDIVFSSNVLEHIKDIDSFQKEIIRVLKPGGHCVHAMPTGAWRFWTNCASYIELVQRIILLIPDGIPTSLSLSKPRNLLSNLYGLLTAYKVPPRHGEEGNAFTEIYLFSKRKWVKHFKENNFSVNAVSSMGLFYTGHMVLGSKIPLQLRKILSYVLGSACVLYTVIPMTKEEA